MLHAISWSVFLLSFLCLASAYWLFIAFFFYSKEVKTLLKGRSGAQGAIKDKIEETTFPLNINGDSNDDQINKISNLRPSESEHAASAKSGSLFAIAYNLTGELKEAISMARIKKSAREELIFSLQILLNKETYNGLQYTPFKIAINNLIESECRTVNSISFSPEEFDLMWKK